MILRWDPCIVQDASAFETFLSEYIDRPNRRCLLIGGAGFDPRADIVPRLFKQVSNCHVQGVFFREERLLDQPVLRARADNTEVLIKNLFPTAQFPRIDIFAGGVTVTGGRRALEVISAFDCGSFSDVFVDISALSCGVFFPIVSYLVQVCDGRAGSDPNLHLLTAEKPSFDHGIRGIPADSAAFVHGFKGPRSLDSSETEALLWIPTLSPGHEECLAKIYQHIQRKFIPLDVCPILPFPCSDPLLTDRLVDQYRENLATWNSDHRNFLYAAESDPLDSYRAISALVSQREQLFAALGGSQVILSPLGNKMLSVGAMLAAIEKSLPVAMVESVGYDMAIQTPGSCSQGALKHVWLCGEAYRK